MQRSSILMLGFSLVLAALIFVEPMYAGPGGKMASAVFDGFWGRVLLAALTIAPTPWIVCFHAHEHLAVKRTQTNLRFMARLSSHLEPRARR